MNTLEKNKRGFLLRNMWQKPSFFALFFVLRKVFLIIWTCFFHAYRVKWGMKMVESGLQWGLTAAFSFTRMKNGRDL